MINLKQIQEKIFSHKFFIFSILAISILIILIIVQTLLRSNSKQSIAIQKPLGLPSQTKKTEFNFEANKLDMPKKMPTYKITSQPLSPEAVSSLAQKLGFLGKPKILPAPINDSLYIWQNPNETLTVSVNSQRLTYRKLPNQSFEQPLQESKDKGTQSVKLFLNKLKFNISNDNIENPKTSIAFDNIINKSTKSQIQTKFTILTYFQNIESVPIVSSVTTDQSIQATIYPNGEIQNISIDLLSQNNPEKLKDYQSNSFDKIMNSLKNGEGATLSVTGSNEHLSYKENAEILKLNITEAKLAYLKDFLLPDQLIPVVIFGGRATLNNYKEKAITIAVPAIQDIQFKQP